MRGGRGWLRRRERGARQRPPAYELISQCVHLGACAARRGGAQVRVRVSTLSRTLQGRMDGGGLIVTPPFTFRVPRGRARRTFGRRCLFKCN